MDRIQRVQRDRAAGLSLASAIDRVSAAPASERSLFGGLRRRWPDHPVQTLRRPTLEAISRAIEDEALTLADRPVVIGSFQREPAYRRSESRWRELSRTASTAIVFADFERSRARRAAPSEIAMHWDEPLLREWAVICASRDLSALVVGVELPPNGHRHRRFDTLWSIDREVVHEAVVIAAELARPLPASDELRDLPPPPPDSAADGRAARAVLARVVARLDAATAV